MVKPGGTGRPKFAISARPGPLREQVAHIAAALGLAAAEP